MERRYYPFRIAVFLYSNDHVKYNRLKSIPPAIPPTAPKVGEAHGAAPKSPAYLCTLV
jgi:hypothetical protein